MVDELTVLADEGCIANIDDSARSANSTDISIACMDDTSN